MEKYDLEIGRAYKYWWGGEAVKKHLIVSSELIAEPIGANTWILIQRLFSKPSYCFAKSNIFLTTTKSYTN